MHIAALHQPSQVQLNQQGNLKHFLTIEGLSRESLTKILDTAQSFLDDNNNFIKFEAIKTHPPVTNIVFIYYTIIYFLILIIILIYN